MQSSRIESCVLTLIFARGKPNCDGFATDIDRKFLKETCIQREVQRKRFDEHSLTERIARSEQNGFICEIGALRSTVDEIAEIAHRPKNLVIDEIRTGLNRMTEEAEPIIPTVRIEIKHLGDLYAESGQTLQGSFSAGWLARSRLYRSQILQVNTRWKALVEIYKMHCFAPFWNP